jgi:hypothetical protein
VVVGRAFNHSDQRWAACDDCKQLIDAGDQPALTSRSFALMLELHPELQGAPLSVLTDIKLWLTSLHQAFFKYKQQ